MSRERSLDVTPEAAEVLRRSLELGGVDPETGGVRLRAARGLGGGADIQVEFAAGPMAGEEVFELQGLRIFVDPALDLGDAVVALEPQHDRVVVRPL